jgi:hypothetical protein
MWWLTRNFNKAKLHLHKSTIPKQKNQNNPPKLQTHFRPYGFSVESYLLKAKKHLHYTYIYIKK